MNQQGSVCCEVQIELPVLAKKKIRLSEELWLVPKKSKSVAFGVNLNGESLGNIISQIGLPGKVRDKLEVSRLMNSRVAQIKKDFSTFRLTGVK